MKLNTLGIEFEMSDGYMPERFSKDYGHLAEKDNLKKLFSLASKDKIFCSAGGHVGEMEMALARIYGKVHSLEADPFNYSEFQKNLKLNGYTNVTIDQLALFDDSVNTIKLSRNVKGAGDESIFLNTTDSTEVPTITLKKWFEKYNVQKNSVLMLDIEGAEYALFDDIEFFEKYTPTILIELHIYRMNNGGPQNVERFIKALNNLKHVYPNIDTTDYKKYVENLESPFRGYRHELYIPKN